MHENSLLLNNTHTKDHLARAGKPHRESTLLMQVCFFSVTSTHWGSSVAPSEPPDSPWSGFDFFPPGHSYFRGKETTFLLVVPEKYKRREAATKNPVPVYWYDVAISFTQKVGGGRPCLVQREENEIKKESKRERERAHAHYV